MQEDKLGLGSFMLQLQGVAGANFFPSRIDGRSLRVYVESKESRSNAEGAHGDAEQVWLNNFVLANSPYRVYNRDWEFSSEEKAVPFGDTMADCSCRHTRWWESSSSMAGAL